MKFWISISLIVLVSADEHTHIYSKQEDIVIWHNTIGPRHNHQETYEYTQLPFCLGSAIDTHNHESLGESLLGIQLIHSGLDVHFQENVNKTKYCSRSLNDRDVGLFNYAISNNYWFQTYVDNLPLFENVGFVSSKDDKYLYTHKLFNISYNDNRIIQVNMSMDSPIILTPDLILNLTYSVNWFPTNQSFETRFKNYLDSDFFGHEIHWWSVLNSFVMVSLLVAVVSLIFFRTLKKDFTRYEREHVLLEMERDLGDDYGWKLIYGDVFRQPSYLRIFSAINGTGMHLCLLGFLVITYTILGDLYVERGTILTVSIFIYSLCSIISGYYSAALYGKYGGKYWIKTMLTSALLWPGIVAVFALAINFVAISYNSARAIPFTTMVAIISIWLLLVFPLTLLGTLMGKNWASRSNFPCRVNPIPRPIPDKRWYQDSTFLVCVSGLLPFGSIFIELYFIFTSFWTTKIYFVYGFMLAVFILLIIVTCCVSIVSTYFLLNSEDHRWHWQAFLSGGSTAFYIFLYAVYYFNAIAKMSGFFQMVWYFGYTILGCFGIFCLLGSVGYYASEVFKMPPLNRKIAVLGGRAVGKSSLIVQFVENHFAETYYPTIESTFSKLLKHKGHEYIAEIVDTAGQDEFSLLNSKHAVGIHGYVLVYSVASKQSFEICKIIRDKILNFCGLNTIPLVLVGNKVDLHAQRQVQTSDGEELAREWKCSFVEVSAKVNQNITKIFDLMLDEIEKENGESSAKSDCVIL